MGVHKNLMSMGLPLVFSPTDEIIPSPALRQACSSSEAKNT
jgi:hypothetical protein